ncbi:unnamed protein product [Orchesella dallaii]|uniref:Peptidase S1 domain-containing protein n=1 Tax=Orchesella dallaii TaxID=48710 RepID=A0ABP1R1S6_9HEXA
MENKSVKIFVVLLYFIVLTTCIQNGQKEESDYIKVSEHPEINEDSPFDPTPIITHFVPKPTPASVISTCRCGEHEFNGTRTNVRDCGERPLNDNIQRSFGNGPTSLVENGTFTDKSQFPWVVALVERKANGSAIHFCGGTLISSKLILTATHCFSKRKISETEIWLNERNFLLATDVDHPTLKIKAQRLIVYPNFNPIMFYNDISLVELSEHVQIDKSYLRPICLPKDTSYDLKEYAYTAGWGRISYFGPKSDALLHVCLPLLTHEDCTEKTVHYYKTRVNDFMICAGDIKNGGKDSCPVGRYSWKQEKGIVTFSLESFLGASNVDSKNDPEFTPAFLNGQKEETHYVKVSEYPEINEDSPFDPTPIITHFVPKPSPSYEISTCRCGEHAFNGTKMDVKGCGERPPNDNIQRSLGNEQTSLIENGTITDKSQFPWVVALVERKANGSAIHFCAGTLISSKLILTATHCFAKRNISETEVWLNERNFLLDADVDHPTLKIKAQRIIKHPNFNPIMYYNDISLVELSEHVQINERHLRPICLPKDQSYDLKEYAYTAGWGGISTIGPKSDELRHVCLPLLSHHDCTTKTVHYFKTRVNDFMICAGDIKNGGSDSCPGDSGGPLFVEAGEGDRHFLVGIASWSEKCGLKGRPGVYTRVSKYLSWIYYQANLIDDNKLCD